MHVHPDLIEELMIFFKALLFYLPRCLWKSFEGGLMETFGRYCSFCPRPRVLYFCTQFLPLSASSVPDLLSLAFLLCYYCQLKVSWPFLICLWNLKEVFSWQRRQDGEKIIKCTRFLLLLFFPIWKVLFFSNNFSFKYLMLLLQCHWMN